MSKLKLSLKPTTIIILVAFVLVLGGTILIAKPQAEKLNNQIVTRKQKEVEAKQLEEKYKALVTLANELGSKTEEINRLSIAYPGEEQVVEALVQSQTMAGQAGVTIVSLAPSRGKAGGVPIAMNVKGTYQAVSSLLRELNNNLRPTIIRSLNIVAGSEKEPGVVNASLIVTYEFSAKAAPSTSPTNTSQSQSSDPTGVGAAPAAPPEASSP